MAIPSIFVLVLGMVITALIVYALFVAIPCESTSIFRYGLWRVHDELIQAVLSGALPEHNKAVRMGTAQVEGLIKNSRQATLINWYLGPKLPQAVVDQKRRELDSSLGELDESQRHLLLSLLDRCANQLVCQLVFGSVTGWIVLIAVLIATIIRLVIRAVSELIGDGIGAMDDAKFKLANFIKYAFIKEFDRNWRLRAFMLMLSSQSKMKGGSPVELAQCV